MCWNKYLFSILIYKLYILFSGSNSCYKIKEYFTPEFHIYVTLLSRSRLSLKKLETYMKHTGSYIVTKYIKSYFMTRINNNICTAYPNFNDLVYIQIKFIKNIFAAWDITKHNTGDKHNILLFIKNLWKMENCFHNTNEIWNIFLKLLGFSFI